MCCLSCLFFTDPSTVGSWAATCHGNRNKNSSNQLSDYQLTVSIMVKFLRRDLEGRIVVAWPNLRKTFHIEGTKEESLAERSIIIHRSG